MPFRGFSVSLLLLSLAGCVSEQGQTAAGVELTVAPLTLPGVGKICYDLRVTDGGTKNDPIVWTKGTPGLNGGSGDSDALCSSNFGNGVGGDLTFVGACVASPVDAGQDYRTNSVTLWIDGVYDSSNVYISPTGANGWKNPCVDGCTLTAQCRENSDTAVEFNLTILREANQGFFDIGVNFDDIFCSAKVDCKNGAGQPLDLLFNLATGQRDTTIVTGFACTAGPGASIDTVLYRNPLTVTCGANPPIILDPGAGKGNVWTTDAIPADAVFQYAVYAGNEAMSCGGQPCNKRYWNVAIGFNEATPNCTLTTSMTASAGALTGFKTPTATTYPYIDINVPLTNASAFTCSQHKLDDGGGVGTVYTPISTPKNFATSFAGGAFAKAVPSVISVAVISGGSVGSAASGNGLATLVASGQSYTLFGTASGAQPLQTLYDNLSQYPVIVVLDFVGTESALTGVMTTVTNRGRLENWVRSGGVLSLGVYNDAGATEAMFGPPGFDISGQDDRADHTILNDLTLFHTPYEIGNQLRTQDSWERLVSWPTEATASRELISNGTVVDFRLGTGYVFVNGVPIKTLNGGWPGLEETHALGSEYYSNLFLHLRTMAATIIGN